MTLAIARLRLHAMPLVLLTAVVGWLYSSLLNGRADYSHEGTVLAQRIFEYHREMFVVGFLQPQLFPDTIAGAGSAFPTFYPPFGYLVGVLFQCLFGDPILAANLCLFTSVLVGTWILYGAGLAVRRDRGLAVLAAVLVAASPYRFVQVLVRGALAESWFTAVFPLVLWGGIEFLKGRCAVLKVGLGTLLTVLSHSVMAMFGSVLLAGVAVVILVQQGWRRATGYATSGLLGGAMAAFYLLPQQTYLRGVYASDIRFMLGSWTRLERERVFPIQLFWSSPDAWFGASSFGGPDADRMSFSLGLAGLLSVLLIAWGLCRRGCGGGRRWRILLAWVLVVLVVNTLFMCHPGWFSWLPQFVTYIQFPWRLLAFLAVLLPMAAMLALAGGKRVPRAVPWLLVPLVAWGVGSFQKQRRFRDDIRPADYTVAYLGAHEGLRGLTTLGEYLPRELPIDYLEPGEGSSMPEPPRIVTGAGSIVSWDQTRPGTFRLVVEISHPPGAVKLPLVYYPFWGAMGAGGGAISVSNLEGYLQVSLPGGRQEVTVARYYPAAFRVGWVISLFAALGLAALALQGRRATAFAFSVLSCG